MFRFISVVLLADALVSKQMNDFVHMGPGRKKKKKTFLSLRSSKTMPKMCQKDMEAKPLFIRIKKKSKT